MQARRIINMLAVATIVVGTTTACATKKFVRTEVGGVNTRVETLSQSIEATQQETRANQARIGEVDKKTDQVGIWAKDAQTLRGDRQRRGDRRICEDRRRRSVDQAARLRSGHQRRSGPVQVRLGRAPRGSPAADRPDDRGPEVQPARQLRRDRRAHRFERRQDGESAHRRSNAPKR